MMSFMRVDSTSDGNGISSGINSKARNDHSHVVTHWGMFPSVFAVIFHNNLSFDYFCFHLHFKITVLQF